MKDTLTHRYRHPGVHQVSFHTWDAILAFRGISPGKDTPPCPIPETEDTYYGMQNEISDISQLIGIINLRYLPQCGRLLCYPVLAATLGGEKVHRRAVPFMG